MAKLNGQVTDHRNGPAGASATVKKHRDIIVIGASAGGLPALLELVRAFPADMPAALFIVVHTSAEGPGLLAALLDRAGAMPAAAAEDGQAVAPGRIYVAPPNRHLLLEEGRIKLAPGPKENGFRPAVDPLFRTAARSYGRRVIGVVLSGGLDDGTAGLGLIKRMGGVALAQDPADAMYASMPASAAANVALDFVLPARTMGAKLVELCGVELTGEAVMPDSAQHDIAEHGDQALLHDAVPGVATPFTCPECGGALWEQRERQQLRYRCHVGHAYTGDGLLFANDSELESALWWAVRSLEESAALHRRLARHATERHLAGVAETYEAKAGECEKHSCVIRGVLEGEVQARANGDDATILAAPKKLRGRGRRNGRAKAPDLRKA